MTGVLLQFSGSHAAIQTILASAEKQISVIMHVQRIHYWKLVLLLIFIISFLGFVIQTGPNSNKRNSIDVEVVDLLKTGDNEARKSLEESLQITAQSSCPVCLGNDLCTEIKSNFLTISIFSGKESYGEIFKGCFNGEDTLKVLSPHSEIWDAWDRQICRNVSRQDTCHVAQVAKSSFLYKWRGDANYLRKFQTEDISGQHLTACVTQNMVRTMEKAFDDDHDGLLSPEEKSIMLTSVAVSPATIMLRLGRTLGMTSFPVYIGSCGRLSVYQGDMTSISEYLTSDWDTRAELASQILALINGLLSHTSYVMIVWNLGPRDFSVTSSGQVVLTGLDKVTLVDRSLLVAPAEDRQVCNRGCFQQFQKDVMMETPRGQPGKGCGHSVQYSDMMYSDVCTYVFSDTTNGPGLLNSASAEVRRLIAECSIEEGIGGRWKAVDSLLTLLNTGDIDSSTTETNTTNDPTYDPDTSGDSGSGNHEETTTKNP